MTYNKHIDYYIELVEKNKIETSTEVKDAIRLLKNKLDNEDIVIDHDKIDKAIEIMEKYFFPLIHYQKFLVACIVGLYYKNDSLVFNEFFIMMGRGNGKNGFISALGFYFSTKHHGVEKYNIEIVANSESQAMTSFEDIYELIDNNLGLKKRYYYTKEKIINRKTKSRIKYNTSNAKTKDGQRPRSGYI